MFPAKRVLRIRVILLFLYFQLYVLKTIPIDSDDYEDLLMIEVILGKLFCPLVIAFLYSVDFGNGFDDKEGHSDLSLLMQHLIHRQL